LLRPKLGRKDDTEFDNSEILIVPLAKNLLVIGNIGFSSKIRFLMYGTAELIKNVVSNLPKKKNSIDF
jgi:hypothetical protein